MSQINNEKLYLTIELIKNLLVAGGKREPPNLKYLKYLSTYDEKGQKFITLLSRGAQRHYGYSYYIAYDTIERNSHTMCKLIDKFPIVAWYVHCN